LRRWVIGTDDCVGVNALGTLRISATVDA